MGEALLIGALSASSLALGAAIALRVRLAPRVVALLLAFGAGALISAVSFELAAESLEAGGPGVFAAGLALGALAFFGGDLALERREGRRRPHRPEASPPSGGTVLALGALLDGVPEQAALGMGLAGGESANVALLAAIFVSNVPEALGSAAQLRRDGWPGARVVGLWAAVAVAGVAATAGGFALLDGAGGDTRSAISAFAAGAVLCMLVDSMVPESRAEGGRGAGLAAIVGFAVAVLLSQLPA